MEFVVVIGVDDCAAEVDESVTGESTNGMPDGVMLGLTGAVFCAKTDAVGVGSLSVTEPESRGRPSRLRTILWWWSDMGRDITRYETSEGRGETTGVERNELARFPSQKGSEP